MMKSYNLAIFLIVFSMFVLVSCNKTNTITTNAIVKVIEKNENISKKEYSVVIETLNENTQQFDLKVDSINTWNLIEVNQQYSVIYTLKSKNTGNLKLINNIKG